MRSGLLVSLAVLGFTVSVATGGGPVDPAKFNSKVKVACGGDSIIEEMIPMLRSGAKETKVDLIDLHVALAPHRAYFSHTVHSNAKGATVIAQTVHRALTGKEARLAMPASR